MWNNRFSNNRHRRKQRVFGLLSKGLIFCFFSISLQASEIVPRSEYCDFDVHGMVSRLIAFPCTDNDRIFIIGATYTNDTLKKSHSIISPQEAIGFAKIHGTIVAGLHISRRIRKLVFCRGSTAMMYGNCHAKCDLGDDTPKWFPLSQLVFYSPKDL